MTSSPQIRLNRRHNSSAPDQRNPFARDRDRILYCSALHRLAGVTQIVKAGEEEVFHTRQQHTYKVAQIGRRLAEYCRDKFPDEAKEFGLEPEVVEAAALAHDLGHPPFGHAAEKALDELITGYDEFHDGFEGNAQTFRILTKTSVRFMDSFGLDLTRATLAATLKYPWLRDRTNPDRSRKWSVYRTEQEDFEFAQPLLYKGGKCIEAELMDWADDIAYSVHDLEDFHRCNFLPWQVIMRSRNKEALITATLKAWHGAPSDALKRLEQGMRTFENIFGIFEDQLCEPYVGNRLQRQALRNFTSRLISPLITCVSLDSRNGFVLAPEYEAMVLLLKQITRNYIVSSPALRAQQEGQVLMLRALFDKINKDCATNKLPPYMPHRFGYLMELAQAEAKNGAIDRLRFAADCICSLTEREVTGLHSRLFGASSGSVLDPIVR